MPRQIPIALTARAAPAPVSSFRRPTLVAPPPALPEAAASQAYQRQLVERAAASTELPAPAAFFWGTLTAAAIVGGHTFPAGTRVVYQPSQTTVLKVGKAQVGTSVVRVWLKFGQTFDASSWISGWLAPGLIQSTGQTATWSDQVGFGSLAKTGLGQASTVVSLAVTVGIIALGGVAALYLYDRLKKRR